MNVVPQNRISMGSVVTGAVNVFGGARLSLVTDDP